MNTRLGGKFPPRNLLVAFTGMVNKAQVANMAYIIFSSKILLNWVLKWQILANLIFRHRILLKRVIWQTVKTHYAAFHQGLHSLLRQN